MTKTDKLSMLTIFASIFSQEWREFYGDTEHKTYENQVYTQLSTYAIQDEIGVANYSIFNCLFISMEARSIDIATTENPHANLLIEECVFANNKAIESNTDSLGLNIYFDIGDKCFQNKVCSYNCTSSENLSILGYHSCTDSNTNVKQYISICKTTHAPSGNTLTLFWENQDYHRLTNSNISSISDLERISYLYDALNGSIIDYCHFKCFVGNYLFSYESGITSKIEKCNFIENEVNELISSYNTYVLQCNFIGNVDRNKSPNLIFETFNGKITLSECYFSFGSITKSGDGIVEITNNASHPIGINFNFYRTHECDFNSINDICHTCMIHYSKIRIFWKSR